MFLIIIIIIVSFFIAAAAIVLAFLQFSPVVGKTPDKTRRDFYEKTNSLYYDGKFHNENDVSLRTEGASKKSRQATPDTILPTEKLTSFERGEKGKLSVTWLGHSSSFVRLGDNNILIDPVLGKRASPVGFAGPKRFSELPVKAEDVKNIDVVFISHDHYDHLDYGTIKTIDKNVGCYIVPLGVDAILSGWGIDESRLYPLAWWESIELGGVRYTLTPGQHFTGRNPLKANAALWGGMYMNDGAHIVYYTGDTGSCDVFGRVYERLGRVDLMLGECGQYDKMWANLHMFPEQSVQAAIDAHARWLIPVHWGAYCICNHAWYESPERALADAEKKGQNISTPMIGQSVEYDRIDQYRERWWEEYK